MSAAAELTEADIRAARAAIEACYAQGWSDGLPVVPPIGAFLDEFLAQTARVPDEVLITQEHLDRTCTVRQAAINAVMAGCLPEYFPVLLAALDAFRGIGAGSGLLQSTTGQAPLLVVNGSVRGRLGFNSAENIFGPGDRANTTIGRAMRLIIMNTLGIRPHEFDQSAQGTPLKYSCCIAENEEESPWEPLHVERGFAAEESTVTIQMTRSDLHVEHRSTQSPEEILLTIADSMSYAGGIYEAPPYNRTSGSIVVMGPEHAQIVARGGWTKQQVREFLFEHFGKTKRELRRFGKIIGLEDEAEDAFIHTAPSPDAILLVVAGSPNAGVSTVCSNFAWRNATVAVGPHPRPLSQSWARGDRG
ncbi:MAG TPA: hypothetical protein VKV26_01160 [Dehalococcoidia bacterium]|nr:hypothetical protein [Dehalococcoidia bacterium]